MIGRRIASGFVLAIALVSYGPVCAQEKNSVERQQGKSVTTITPIFSQLLKTGWPQGFELISSEKTQGQFYIRESVLKGERLDSWRQMITFTGMKDLASKPGLTPNLILDRMIDGFRRGCPFSFNTQAIRENLINGADAAVAVVSCGTSPATGGKTSESAVIAVFRGQVDFYTIQWAERATPSNAPIPIDLKKWTGRFKELGPIRLCPIVPGEKAPYPSCVGDGVKAPT
jgi:hypothetical protein